MHVVKLDRALGSRPLWRETQDREITQSNLHIFRFVEWSQTFAVTYKQLQGT